MDFFQLFRYKTTISSTFVTYPVSTIDLPLTSVKPLLLFLSELACCLFLFMCFSEAMPWTVNSQTVCRKSNVLSQWYFSVQIFDCIIFFSLNSWALPQTVSWIVSLQSLHLFISLFSALHCRIPFFPIISLLADQFES